jgi:AraC-like DNA-binding protein
MLKFEYNHLDYVALLAEWQRQLGGTLDEWGGLTLPGHMAEGEMRAYNLPNGLSVALTKMHLKQPLHLVRRRIHNEYYVLKLDIVEIPEPFEFSIEEQVNRQPAQKRAVIMLISTLFETSFILPEGFKQRSLYIMFSREWLGKYLAVADFQDVLKRYLMLQAANINAELLDAPYRSLMDEVMDAGPHPVPPGRIEARVMMLVERFFERLREKSQHMQAWDMRSDDIHRMVRVEAALLENLGQNPPTLEALARQAGISPTKMKRDFKEVYGQPPFEYYQRVRMNKAREMLLSGEYTVKEAGYALGYSNLSNFAYAFKKEFSVLPSEIIL